jgi:hypothetical protein
MIARQGRLLLAFSAGFLLALTAESAFAVLIIEPVINEFTTSTTFQSTTFSAPVPARSQDEENNDRPVLEIALGLVSLPATTGRCNSVTQWSGGEWSGAALAGAFWHLPPNGPRTLLPGEARVILPARVPFDLLRPV